MARGDRPPPFPPPSEPVNKSDHSEGRPPVDTFLAPRGLRSSRTSASPPHPPLRLPRLFPRADRRRRGGSTSPPPACPPRTIEIEQLPGVPPLRSGMHAKGQGPSPAPTCTAPAVRCRPSRPGGPPGLAARTGCRCAVRGTLALALRASAVPVGVAPRPGRRHAGASPRGERPAGRIVPMSFGRASRPERVGGNLGRLNPGEGSQGIAWRFVHKLSRGRAF